MKTGRTLPELAGEIERQSKNRRDLLADTRELTLLSGTEGSELIVKDHGEFGVRRLAQEQIADHLDIPRRYFGRLQREHRTLLDHTVSTLFRERPSRRLVRTLDGEVRAFLSDRYRRLDNEELCEAVLPVLGEIPDVQFPSVEITDSRLYIKAVAPRVQGEVRKGDVVQAGVVISNSEVGQGALSVQPLIYRLVCENGLIVSETLRRFHVGRQIDSEDAVMVFKDETLAADDKAFWLKVRDVVRAAVNESRFQVVLGRLRMSSETPDIEDPSYGVQELGRRFGLSEGEQQSVLRLLTLGGDLTQYGALNAVTRASQDVECYDRATELEAAGGLLLGLDAREWATIARPAARQVA